MLILLFRTTFLIFVANIQIKTDITNINGTKRKHIDEIRLHSPPYREGKVGGPFLCLRVFVLKIIAKADRWGPPLLFS